MRRLPAAALASLLLVACGDADREPEEGVFDPLVDAVDEAEQVEALTLQQKDRLDAALDEAEGDADRERK